MKKKTNKKKVKSVAKKKARKPAAKKSIKRRKSESSPKRKAHEIVRQSGYEKPKEPKPLKPTKRVGKAEWGPIRRMLVEKRNATMQAMRKIKDHDLTTDVGDEADQAGQLVEKELQFELSDNERNLLDQIEGALRKMDKDTYGLCEHCAKPINKLRIKALPFARYCIVCQNNSERAVF
ncbi:MAG: TraR/DksA family transcriptional regulator [Elusimicrobiota bacterium]